MGKQHSESTLYLANFWYGRIEFIGESNLILLMIRESTHSEIDSNILIRESTLLNVDSNILIRESTLLEVDSNILIRELTLSG